MYRALAIVRGLTYRLSFVIVFIASSLLCYVIHCFCLWSMVMSRIDSIIGLAGVLAGFLFAGQSIIVTIPNDSKLIRFLCRQGYLSDFHKFCRYAESALIGAAFLGVFIQLHCLIKYIFFFLFSSGTLISLWAVSLFGWMLKYYVMEVTMNAKEE